MDTPICDFVKGYAASDPLRLHMPGHKGRERLGPERLDITEVTGADVLYHAEGIIAHSQNNAAALFHAGKTLYSTEGSSLSIRAMLYLVLLWAKATGRHPRITAGRNAHKVFMTACALLDLDIDWLYPRERQDLLSCRITPEELNDHLTAARSLPAAVYITSPDYLGHTADLSAMADICHRHGVLLLVDNAHGAYLRFLPEDRHPLALGADLCCDSAHKTLPVLTGGGYLHISLDAPALLKEQAEAAMSLFASTSPSYLVLQSLDAANAVLAHGYRERLAAFAEAVGALKARLSAHELTPVGDEPLKLTLAPKGFGYTGTALADLLTKKGLICEFCDPDYLVLMLTPELEHRDLLRLEQSLLALPRREAIFQGPPPLPRPRRVCSVRQALFSPARELPTAECLGKVLAQATVSCPPAIPVAVCGECLDEAALACLAYYGTKTCRVME